MQRLMGSISAVIGGLFLAAASTAQADAEALTALVDNLSSTENLQADFVQTTRDDLGQELQSLQGNIIVEQPGKLRWETLDPYPQLVVSDGELLWAYDMDLEQVTIRNLEQRMQDTPALLLSGDSAEISANFDVDQLKERTENVEEFILTPKDTSQLFSELKLAFENDTLSRMMILDAAGQKTLIEFSKVELNQSLDALTFVFDVPEGVDVIDGRHGF